MTTTRPRRDVILKSLEQKWPKELEPGLLSGFPYGPFRVPLRATLGAPLEKVRSFFTVFHQAYRVPWVSRSSKEDSRLANPFSFKGVG